MKDFAQRAPSTLQNIHGLFTDIDDTLTTDGTVTPDALQALADLKAAGLSVVAVTGRWGGVSRLRCSGRSMRSWREMGLWLCGWRLAAAEGLNEIGL